MVGSNAQTVGLLCRVMRFSTPAKKVYTCARSVAALRIEQRLSGSSERKRNNYGNCNNVW
jgi:hypothetical protein